MDILKKGYGMTLIPTDENKEKLSSYEKCKAS